MQRPALGHILGYTALIIILTAGAAQSLSGTDTVFTDDIKDGQVFGSDIRDGTIKSADVADDSLTGANIKEATLMPTCPSGMTRVADICRTSLRAGPRVFMAAVNDCYDEKLRLPSVSEARLVVGTTDNEILTDVYYEDDDGSGRVTLVNSSGPLTDVDDDDGFRAYYCVTTVGARP